MSICFDKRRPAEVLLDIRIFLTPRVPGSHPLLELSDVMFAMRVVQHDRQRRASIFRARPRNRLICCAALVLCAGRSWTLQSEKGNPEQPFRASVIESQSDPPASYLDALISAGLMSICFDKRRPAEVLLDIRILLTPRVPGSHPLLELSDVMFAMRVVQHDRQRRASIFRARPRNRLICCAA